MPYITKFLKDEARKRAETGHHPIMKSPGELNYELTLKIIKYIEQNGPLSYQIINDVIGALEGAKLEFYRRIVWPYENLKISENGDVYNTLMQSVYKAAITNSEDK